MAYASLSTAINFMLQKRGVKLQNSPSAKLSSINERRDLTSRAISAREFNFSNSSSFSVFHILERRKK